MEIATKSLKLNIVRFLTFDRTEFLILNHFFFKLQWDGCGNGKCLLKPTQADQEFPFCLLKERYRTITPSYYGGVDAVIIVYDLTVKESFDNVQHWVDEIAKYARKNSAIFLIGNKADLTTRRTVSYSTLKSYAERRNFFYYETSARLEDNNVFNTFVEISKRLEGKLEPVKVIKQTDSMDFKKFSLKS